MEGMALWLALIGALFYSVLVVRRYFVFSVGRDLFAALLGPLIPLFSMIRLPYSLSTILEDVLIAITAPVFCLCLSWVLSTSVEGLALSFSVSFAVHLWLLRRAEGLH